MKSARKRHVLRVARVAVNGDCKHEFSTQQDGSNSEFRRPGWCIEQLASLIMQSWNPLIGWLVGLQRLADLDGVRPRLSE